MRDEAAAQLRSSLDKQTADNSLLASQNASLQADLRAKSLELHTAAEEYANLEALTKSAADEQAANEEQLVEQITRLQHKAKVNLIKQLFAVRMYQAVRDLYYIARHLLCASCILQLCAWQALKGVQNAFCISYSDTVCVAGAEGCARGL